MIFVVLSLVALIALWALVMRRRKASIEELSRDPEVEAYASAVVAEVKAEATRPHDARLLLAHIRSTLTKFDWLIYAAILDGCGTPAELLKALSYDRSRAGLGGKLRASLVRLQRRNLITYEGKPGWVVTNPTLRARLEDLRETP